jgi:hypothetical protein
MQWICNLSYKSIRKFFSKLYIEHLKKLILHLEYWQYVTIDLAKKLCMLLRTRSLPPGNIHTNSNNRAEEKKNPCRGKPKLQKLILHLEYWQYVTISSETCTRTRTGGWHIWSKKKYRTRAEESLNYRNIISFTTN